eukprot:CAMPEP_0175457178 /NCGR_PEP_ID=MMETSP0095-20121207/65929_1 /TAXON_ID=311494 /ORGANISM="Alexandrium monilatum, Strain CCMP3105" /LENGTH=62 /DNA_ID=CAMNT_0016758029 /DNA_START=402 /DNA_END=590 /DNA_ORIENTATION=+
MKAADRAVNDKCLLQHAPHGGKEVRDLLLCLGRPGGNGLVLVQLGHCSLLGGAGGVPQSGRA